MNFKINLQKFILEWNARWPFDYYIRKKHGIIFGSPEHRALNFIDMAIEYAEDNVLAREDEKSMHLNERNFEQKIGLKIKGSEDNQGFKKAIKMNKKQIEEEFENIDLSKFNDK